MFALKREHGSKMHKIFDSRNRLQKILEVEAALARAHAEVGNIPAKAAEEISRKASIKYIKPEEVGRLKKVTKHGIVAVIQLLSSACEEGAGGYVHLGATSNDISDTALALQLKEAVEILLKGLEDVKGLLLSLGGKFTVFAEEIERSIERITECIERLLVGKMTGAVGTQAAFGDKGLEIQKIVMRQLGLKSAAVSNQMIPRDRHAEFIANLGILAGTLENIEREIKGREGIVANLACIVRANILPALENISIEHEGDLTSLPCEQVVIPETCIMVDEMLKSVKDLLREMGR